MRLICALAMVIMGKYIYTLLTMDASELTIITEISLRNGKKANGYY